MVASPRLYESPKAGTVPVHRHEPSQKPALDKVPSGQKQQITYGVRKPLRHDASWFAVCVFLGYLAALGYYLYVRIAFTLDMKDRWYSIIILVIECLGMTAVIPYAFLNMVHTHPTGSQGLPPDDGFSIPDKK